MNRNNAITLLNEIEKQSCELFNEIDNRVLVNQEKVLRAFQQSKVTLFNMAGSSGYGYEDTAKSKLNSVYALAFGAEKALVSPLITCGTHAIFLALSAILRPGDVMLSITGLPYDTLIDALVGENNGSLKDFNISFEKVDMIGDEIDLQAVIKAVKKLKPRMIYLQRSRGYSSRKTLTIDYIAKIISVLKKESPDSVYMVDNCYGEFVETKEPTSVGADIIAGSLIKNPGGGIAPTGGYIAGRADLIDLIERRLTSPTLGNEVGSYNTPYTNFFEGFFIAPHLVGGVLKGNILLGKVAAKIGFKTSPDINQIPEDVIRTIEFNNAEKMIKFVQRVQELSPIDSFVRPEPYDMPGYNDKVIMAAGTFIQGSSIEFSCDGPVKSPYIAYMQGGLTYEHIKLVALSFIEEYL